MSVKATVKDGSSVQLNLRLGSSLAVAWITNTIGLSQRTATQYRRGFAGGSGHTGGLPAPGAHLVGCGVELARGVFHRKVMYRGGVEPPLPLQAASSANSKPNQKWDNPVC